MNYINRLEQDLETEREHSQFLERLLEALYGDGWNSLTIATAKLLKVVSSPNKSVEPTAETCDCKNGPDLGSITYCVACGKDL